MSVVCGCFEVTEEEIRKAVRDGAHSMEAVGEKTNAGTGCGGCIPQIEEIIEEERK